MKYERAIGQRPQMDGAGDTQDVTSAVESCPGIYGNSALLVIPMWYDLYSCSHSPMATTKMLWVDEEGGREEEV